MPKRRPSNPSVMSNPPVQPCSNPRDKACGASLLANARKELEKACDEVSPKCPECKSEARKIIDAMIKAWNYNHGKGNNTSGDNVGGYLCWDWSKAFAEAARSVNAKCWKEKEAMVHKNNSTVVHFFVELKVRGSSGSNGLRYIDDGWFDGAVIHTAPWPPDSNWTRGTWRPSASRYGSPTITGVPPL